MAKNPTLPDELLIINRPSQKPKSRLSVSDSSFFYLTTGIGIADRFDSVTQQMHTLDGALFTHTNFHRDVTSVLFLSIAIFMAIFAVRMFAQNWMFLRSQEDA